MLTLKRKLHCSERRIWRRSLLTLLHKFASSAAECSSDVTAQDMALMTQKKVNDPGRLLRGTSIIIFILVGLLHFKTTPWGWMMRNISIQHGIVPIIPHPNYSESCLVPRTMSSSNPLIPAGADAERDVWEGHHNLEAHTQPNTFLTRMHARARTHTHACTFLINTYAYP